MKEHASFQQISIEQTGFGFPTRSSLWSSMVSVLSFPEGIWVLEGGTSVCTLQRQGKQHMAKQGSLLEQSRVARQQGKLLGAVSDVSS